MTSCRRKQWRHVGCELAQTRSRYAADTTCSKCTCEFATLRSITYYKLCVLCARVKAQPNTESSKTPLIIRSYSGKRAKETNTNKMCVPLPFNRFENVRSRVCVYVCVCKQCTMVRVLRVTHICWVGFGSRVRVPLLNKKPRWWIRIRMKEWKKGKALLHLFDSRQTNSRRTELGAANVVWVANRK